MAKPRLSLSSLRVRLLLLILLAFVPTQILVFYLASRERNDERRRVEWNASRLAVLASAEEQAVIDETKNLLNVIARDPAVRDRDGTDCVQLLSAMVEAFPQYLNLGIIGPDGRIWCSGLPFPPGLDVTDRDYYQRALTTRALAVGSFQIGRITGRPGINIGLPFFTGDGTLLGVAFAAVDLDALDRFERELADWLPPGSVVTKVDERGRILGRNPGGDEWLGRTAPEFPLLYDASVPGPADPSVIGRGGYLHSLARVHGSFRDGEVFVLLSIPEAAAFAAADQMFVRGMVTVFLATLLALVGTWLGANVFFLRPVTALLDATKRLAGGDLAVRSGISRERGELGELAGAFDTMASELQRRQEERDRAEDALRRSEADYRSLVRNAPYGVLRTTPGGRILMVNPALAQMLGYDSEDELLRINVIRDIYVDPESRDRVLSDLHGRDFRGVSLEWQRKDGKKILVRAGGRWVRNDAGEVEYIESFVENETERRSLEEQLRQAQKMEAVGRLAGGVAHDFNNLLGVMLGYSDLTLAELPADHPSRRRVEEIKRAAERAAALTRQLLAFSRRQVLSPKVLNLNGVVDTLDKMLRRLIGEDINLVCRLGVDLWRVRVDPSQVEQVIMNLVVNARDAMPEGGKIILETRNRTLERALEWRDVIVPPGDYVLLTVSDTGQGMDAETIRHVFEPFFTTKEVGKGTGLGLSMAYGIVQQSGGHVTVVSEPGIGTTFSIYLPRVDAAETRPAVPRSRSLPGGAETVLLVEDEEALRGLLCEFLEAGGYTVLEAGWGVEAARIARDHGHPIHLLVTDVVMPGVTGRQLADQVQEPPPRHPGDVRLRLHRRRGHPTGGVRRGRRLPGQAVHPGIHAPGGAGGAGRGSRRGGAVRGSHAGGGRREFTRVNSGRFRVFTDAHRRDGISRGAACGCRAS